MTFTLIMLASLAYSLFRDQRRDPGQHIKAKVWNAIALAYAFIMYAGTIPMLASVLVRFERLRVAYEQPAGFLSARANLIIQLVHIGLAIGVMIAAFGLIRRRDASRQTFTVLLLVMMPFEAIGFYRGFQGAMPVAPDALVLLAGAVFAVAVNGGLVVLYTMRFMKAYFAQVATDPMAGGSRDT